MVLAYMFATIYRSYPEAYTHGVDKKFSPRIKEQLSSGINS